MFIEWFHYRSERIKTREKQKYQLIGKTWIKILSLEQGKFLWHVLGIGGKTENINNLKKADLTFDKDGTMRPDRIIHNTANTPFHQLYTATDGTGFYSEVFLRQMLTLEEKYLQISACNNVNILSYCILYTIKNKCCDVCGFAV